MTFMPSLDKPWFLLSLAYFCWSHEYPLLITKSCETCNLNIPLIQLDHVHLALSLSDPSKSNPSTSIPRIHTHACASGRKLRPGGGARGAGAPMVWPHHSLLRWPPIFMYISLIFYVSWLRLCFDCFLRGRGPSSYINHPKPLPLFTPSNNFSSSPEAL